MLCNGISMYDTLGYLGECYALASRTVCKQLLEEWGLTNEAFAYFAVKGKLHYALQVCKYRTPKTF
jgi:hypothetical protein